MSSNIYFTNEKYKFGYHTPKFSTFYESVDFIIKKTPFTAMQIYLSNSRASISPKIDVDDIIKTRELIKSYGIEVLAHGSLLYNLCGAPGGREDFKFDYNIKNVRTNLPIELDIMAALGGVGVVIHVGSSYNDKGLGIASRNMEIILKKDTPSSTLLSKALSNPNFKKQRRIILENSAHEGGKRGWNLEEISKIISGVSEDVRDQISVCIDTAHIFGAGIYDFGISTDIDRFYKEFDEIIGLTKLKLFHINDSRISEQKGNNAFFGSCKDRHANLGLGYVFDERDESRQKALCKFFKEALSKNIILIGEPPCNLEGMLCDWDMMNKILSSYNIFLLEKV